MYIKQKLLVCIKLCFMDIPCFHSYEAPVETKSGTAHPRGFMTAPARPRTWLGLAQHGGLESESERVLFWLDPVHKSLRIGRVVNGRCHDPVSSIVCLNSHCPCPAPWKCPLVFHTAAALFPISSGFIPEMCLLEGRSFQRSLCLFGHHPKRQSFLCLFRRKIRGKARRRENLLRAFFFLFSPLFFPMLSYVSRSFRDRFNVKAHEVDGDLRRQCRLRPDMTHPEAEAEHYGPGLPPFSVSSDTSQAAFSRSSVCNRQTHDGPTLCISCQEPGSPVPGRLLLPVSCPQKPA